MRRLSSGRRRSGRRLKTRPHSSPFRVGVFRPPGSPRARSRGIRYRRDAGVEVVRHLGGPLSGMPIAADGQGAAAA